MNDGTDCENVEKVSKNITYEDLFNTNISSDFKCACRMDEELDIEDSNCNNAEEWSNYVTYEELLNIDWLKNIEYIHKSDDNIIILDKKINKKILITRQSIGNVGELMKLNPKLKIFNCGGYKIGDYIELDFKNNITLNSLNDELVFYIDEIKISIRTATNMYSLLSDIKRGYDVYCDDYKFTISLKGINENNYADYYNQAIFMASMVSKNDYFLRDDDIKERVEIDNLLKGHYRNKKYNEVFYFYNAAMKIYDTEISFLYLYKILEYFFLIARKDEFEYIIKNYNEGKSIDILIKEITKIYKDNESDQLSILIKSIKEEVYYILNKAKQLNISNYYDAESFAKELYLYRNSIVHGKSDNKFHLKIPNTFCKSEKDIFWKDSVKYISEVLLFKYCIEKID